MGASPPDVIRGGKPVKRVCSVAVLGGAIALAGLGTPAAAAANGAKSAGMVVEVSGAVTATRPLVGTQPLKVRAPIYWGDIVETHRGSSARLLLGGKVTVTVRELSRLEVREEALAQGVRYTIKLIQGKVRASVARMLMRTGEQVEVRTRNAVASVRGTDFIVETAERPARALPFRLVPPGDDLRAPLGETTVVTLSGAVEVSNRLGGASRMERIGAREAVSVSGGQSPVRVPVNADSLTP